jgi:hypothetical protein
MKTYQHFATVLAHLLGSDTAVRLTVNGYMPLEVGKCVGKWCQSGLKVLVQHQYPGHSRNQGVAHGTVSTIGPHGA